MAVCCECKKNKGAKSKSAALTPEQQKVMEVDDIDIDSLEEVVDPRCNPDKPIQVGFDKVQKAVEAIREGVIRTPFKRSFLLSKLVDMEIYLKADFNQITGSFKDRGARYAIMNLTDEQRKKGVISASAGNHAQAMSYHGVSLGATVFVVMPCSAPIMKIQKCKGFGANVIVKGKDMGEAKKLALNLSKMHGLTYINGFDDPDVIAGQGTAGVEICEDLPDMDAVVVPSGGGGYVAGIAVAVKAMCPNCKVIAVEPERAACFKLARDNNKPTVTPMLSTLADGLAVPLIGFNSFATANPIVHKIVTLKEPCIAIAVLKFLENEKCVLEGAGATGLAAILGGHMEEFKGKKVVLMLSGANIDTSVLGRVLERGLAADGKLVKMKVTVSDRIGGVSQLLTDICAEGAGIKHVMHERAWVTSDVYSVLVKCIIETRDYQHSLDIQTNLLKKYDTLQFVDFPAAPPLSVPCE